MNKSARVVINELQRNRRFTGTCPGCGEEFFLADTAMFSVDDEPPQVALDAIKAAREEINGASRRSRKRSS